MVSDVEGDVDVNDVNGAVTLNHISGSAVAHALNENVKVTFRPCSSEADGVQLTERQH